MLTISRKMPSLEPSFEPSFENDFTQQNFRSKSKHCEILRLAIINAKSLYFKYFFMYLLFLIKPYCIFHFAQCNIRFSNIARTIPLHDYTFTYFYAFIKFKCCIFFLITKSPLFYFLCYFL